MKKVFLSLFMLCALFAQAAEIERIEPACWWVDMKNPELQIMVYGKNIAHTEAHAFNRRIDRLDYGGRSIMCVQYRCSC